MQAFTFSQKLFKVTKKVKKVKFKQKFHIAFLLVHGFAGSSAQGAAIDRNGCRQDQEAVLRRGAHSSRCQGQG